MQHTLNVSMVKVASWTNKRAVRIEDGHVWLEVARTENDCHLCQTCTARADRTEAFLQSTEMLFGWVIADGGKWLDVGYTEGEHPLQIPANALGLAVDEYQPAKPRPPSSAGTLEVAEDAKHLKVHIPRWQRNRRVLVDAERILFQVTLGCNHCYICKTRAKTVREGWNGPV